MGFTNPFINLIPPRIQFPLSYKGSWNASTNTPTLVSSVGTKGDFYIVSVAGSTNLNGVSTWNIGDWVVFNGSAWQKVDNSQNVVTVTAPLALNSGVLSIPVATTSANGYLASADWTTFNNKQIALNILAVGVTPNVAGMSLVGPNFNLEAASASFPGVVSTGTQSFAGDKTFTGTIVASNLSGTNHGDFTTSAVTAFSNPTGLILTLGNSTTPQNIALAEADATNPGALSAGTQTIGGNKTFAGTIAASNLSGTNRGDLTTANIGTSAPNATGMNMTSGSPSTPQSLALEAATASFGGVLTAGAQTIGGAKTFNTAPILSSLTASTVLVLDASKNIASSAITSTALATLSQTANQVLIANGASGITSSSALTVSSGTVLNTLAGAAFRGTGSNSYIGIGANSSGTSGSIFGEANTATTYFSNTAAGDTVLRNSDTTKVIRIGVGSGGSQLSVGNTIISTTTNVGIGITTPNAPLQFASTTVNRKVVLYDNNNTDHQFFGFGVNASILRYQVEQTAHSHVFYYGTNSTTSVEIARIMGTGQVAIGTASPNAACILQVDSTTKAFLPPRMTTTQKNAITTPPSGSVVYDLTLGKLCLFGAAAWETITSV